MRTFKKPKKLFFACTYVGPGWWSNTSEVPEGSLRLGIGSGIEEGPTAAMEGVALSILCAWSMVVGVALLSMSATEVGRALSNSGLDLSICSVRSAEVGVALTYPSKAEVGVALRNSAEVGVALSMSAGALNRCNSTEVGVALRISLARNISAEEGVTKVALPPGPEGVTDLSRCSCCDGTEVTPDPPRKNMSAEGVKDRWACAWACTLPNFLLKFKEWY